MIYILICAKNFLAFYLHNRYYVIIFAALNQIYMIMNTEFFQLLYAAVNDIIDCGVPVDGVSCGSVISFIHLNCYDDSVLPILMDMAVPFYFDFNNRCTVCLLN